MIYGIRFFAFLIALIAVANAFQVTSISVYDVEKYYVRIVELRD
jgi:hypothetical protein